MITWATMFLFLCMPSFTIFCCKPKFWFITGILCLFPPATFFFLLMLEWMALFRNALL